MFTKSTAKREWQELWDEEISKTQKLALRLQRLTIADGYRAMLVDQLAASIGRLQYAQGGLYVLGNVELGEESE